MIEPGAQTDLIFPNSRQHRETQRFLACPLRLQDALGPNGTFKNNSGSWPSGAGKAGIKLKNQTPNRPPSRPQARSHPAEGLEMAFSGPFQVLFGPFPPSTGHEALLIQELLVRHPAGASRE